LGNADKTEERVDMSFMDEAEDSIQELDFGSEVDKTLMSQKVPVEIIDMNKEIMRSAEK
jgi:hypothetical protein